MYCGSGGCDCCHYSPERWTLWEPEQRVCRTLGRLGYFIWVWSVSDISPNRWKMMMYRWAASSSYPTRTWLNVFRLCIWSAKWTRKRWSRNYRSVPRFILSCNVVFFFRSIGFNSLKLMWVIRELVKEGILKNGRRSVPVYVENCLEK